MINRLFYITFLQATLSVHFYVFQSLLVSSKLLLFQGNRDPRKVFFFPPLERVHMSDAIKCLPPTKRPEQGLFTSNLCHIYLIKCSVHRLP